MTTNFFELLFIFLLSIPILSKYMYYICSGKNMLTPTFDYEYSL